MRRKGVTAAGIAVLTATTALAVPLLTAVPAVAEPMSVATTNGCLSPYVGSVRLDLTANVENPTYQRPLPEARLITGTVTIPSAGLTAVGAASVEGDIDVDTIVTGPASGRPTLRLELRRTPVTPGRDVVATVRGYTDDHYPTAQVGTTTVAVDSIGVSLRPRRADGSPTRPGELTSRCLRGDQSPVTWMRIQTLPVVSEVLPAPTGVRVTSLTPDSVGLAWNPAVGSGMPPSEYEIQVDEAPVQRVDAANLSTTITGLSPDTTYYVRVRGILRGTGQRSTPLRIHTPPTHVTYYYDVTGSARVRGSEIPLNGEQRTLLDVTAGTHQSTVNLSPVEVPLGNGGSARVEFTPDGTATGTLTAGVFTLSTRQRVTIPSVTVRGRTIPTPGCETAVEVPLTSGPGFTPATGGTLTGAFTVPRASGCGPHTAAVNAALAGSGNRAALTLRPWA
ncbi:fibronectin type III domain-containing protein [Actinokineospora auranticolor]|uniref:Fibronectin type III domain protein n=1 Tax=Actinokineospora auranticolor TaxID=155976 RepID=A0A2S6GG22_9PSEU|nr:fibronectin type III domain-containing protein [Actinokineospora auranticolor]PPK64086.1 fibronectin type III domain protein [Actinokineospora auranticolor]